MSMPEGIYEVDETALSNGDDFFVLDGDFRKEYEEIIDQGFEKCYEFYTSNKKDFQSVFASDVTELSLETVLQGLVQIGHGVLRDEKNKEK